MYFLNKGKTFIFIPTRLQPLELLSLTLSMPSPHRCVDVRFGPRFVYPITPRLNNKEPKEPMESPLFTSLPSCHRRLRLHHRVTAVFVIVSLPSSPSSSSRCHLRLRHRLAAIFAFVIVSPPSSPLSSSRRRLRLCCSNFPAAVLDPHRGIVLFCFALYSIA